MPLQVNIDIGLLSYGLGAALYLLLALLLGTAWRGRLQGALLLAATVISALWCLLLAVYAQTGQPPYLLTVLAEGGRNLAWMAFLLRLLGVRESAESTRELRWLGRGVWLSGAGLALWLLLAGALVPDRIGADRLLAGLALGLVVMAVLGLALVEQLYRNTRREQRWAIKLLCLGLGGLFAYDLFLYSNTLLLRSLDSELWSARGAINALVVPLLAVAASRNPRWSVDVFVSRRVVFHSAALIGAGGYLMLMAAAGYYIRLYGGAWGTVAQVVFLFGALVLLVLLLASGQMRARLRVLLNKHFFRNKYEYREEWLKFTHALSNSADDSELRENIIVGIGETVEAPGGVLWARRPGGQFAPVSTWTLDMPQGSVVAEGEPLVKFMTRTGWVVYLDELRAEPERYEGLVLPPWLDAIWRPWIIVPLLHGDSLEGFVLLARSETVRHLNWEDSDLLKTMGRQAATHLAMMRASEALSEARQFETFNRLSSYVVHDLKNVAAQLGLVTSNARRHLGNPEFVADAMGTVENATTRMNRMLAQLRKGRLEETTTKLVNVRPVLNKVAAARAADRPRPELGEVQEGLIISVDPERLATIVEHIVQNAQEATPADGFVRMSARAEPGYVVIEVADSGCGMDEKFIAERLYKPFDTTKGNAGMGIGVYESREFVLGNGGRMDVNSAPGRGTTFYIRLPTDAGAGPP